MRGTVQFSFPREGTEYLRSKGLKPNKVAKAAFAEAVRKLKDAAAQGST